MISFDGQSVKVVILLTFFDLKPEVHVVVYEYNEEGG